MKAAPPAAAPQPATAAAWVLALADAPEGVSYGTLMDQAAAAGWTRDEVLVAAERLCTALSPTLERLFVEVATGRALDEAAVSERFRRYERGDALAMTGMDVRYRMLTLRPLVDHPTLVDHPALPGTFLAHRNPPTSGTETCVVHLICDLWVEGAQATPTVEQSDSSTKQSEQ